MGSESTHHFTNGEDTARRANCLFREGQKFLQNEGTILTSENSTPEHIVAAYNFIENLLPYADPRLRPNAVERIYTAPFFAGIVARELQHAGISINPALCQIQQLYYWMGRLIEAAPYHIRTDALGQSFLRKLHVPKAHIRMVEIMNRVHTEKLTRDALSPEEIVFLLADNLGRRQPNGDLFEISTLIEYVSGYAHKKNRQSETEKPSERWGYQRIDTALHNINFYSDLIVHLSDVGISYEHLVNLLYNTTCPMPSITFLVRHGQTNNQGRMYNNDKDAHYNTINKEPVDITDEGQEQMRKVASVITNRGVSIQTLIYSPNRRTRHSAACVYEQLQKDRMLSSEFQMIEASKLLDTDAPHLIARYPILADLLEATNNGQLVYLDPQTEDIASITKRYQAVLGEASVSQTRNGTKRTVIVAHGDPIAITMAHELKPTHTWTRGDFLEMSKLGMLNKGGAWELMYSPQGRLIRCVLLPSVTNHSLFEST